MVFPLGPDDTKRDAKACDAQKPKAANLLKVKHVLSPISGAPLRHGSIHTPVHWIGQ